MTGFSGIEREVTAARRHLVETHGWDPSVAVWRAGGARPPYEALIDLRARGECTHHVPGFDDATEPAPETEPPVGVVPVPVAVADADAAPAFGERVWVTWFRTSRGVTYVGARRGRNAAAAFDRYLADECLRDPALHESVVEGGARERLRREWPTLLEELDELGSAVRERRAARERLVREYREGS